MGTFFFPSCFPWNPSKPSRAVAKAEPCARNVPCLGPTSTPSSAQSAAGLPQPHCKLPVAELQAASLVLPLTQPLLSVKGCRMQDWGLSPLFSMARDPVSDTGSTAWREGQEKGESSVHSPVIPGALPYNATACSVPCKKAQFCQQSRQAARDEGKAVLWHKPQILQRDNSSNKQELVTCKAGEPWEEPGCPEGTSRLETRLPQHTALFSLMPFTCPLGF